MISKLTRKNISWAILLVDRKSPYVSKNAKDFLEMLTALRQKQKNPGIRGGVLCRESSYHRKEKVVPFARSTQDYLLENGVILLSIPDIESAEVATAAAEEETKQDVANRQSTTSGAATTTTRTKEDDTSLTTKARSASDATIATEEQKPHVTPIPEEQGLSSGEEQKTSGS